MKKTTLFLICICVLAILCPIVISHSLSNTTFEIQDEYGNQSMLDNISFSTVLNFNNISLSVLNQDASSLQLQSKKEYNGSSVYAMYLPNKNTEILSDWKESDDIVTDDDNSIYYERNLSEVSIYLNYSVYKDGNYIELGTIPTELWYEHSDQIEIIQTSVYDKILDERFTSIADISIQSLPEEMGYSYYDILPIYHNGYYYILPTSTTYTKGQNYIYRGTLKSTENKFSIEKNPKFKDLEYPAANHIDIEKLTPVTMNRNYRAMFLSMNQLVVFSEKDHELFITTYSLEGKKLSENSYKDIDMVDNFYQNDEYICWSNEEDIYVYNTKTNTLSKEGSFSSNDDNLVLVNDFFYKDSTLYAAYSYYYPDGNYDYKLSVWKDDKLQYTGKLDYIISKPSAYQDYMHYELYSIKFER